MDPPENLRVRTPPLFVTPPLCVASNHKKLTLLQDPSNGEEYLKSSGVLDALHYAVAEIVSSGKFDREDENVFKRAAKGTSAHVCCRVDPST